LVRKLASFGSIQDLEVQQWDSTRPKEECLNLFYDFIQKEGKGELLDQEGNEVVPNQNGEFCSRKALYDGRSIPPYAAECLIALGNDLRSTLIHPNITVLQLRPRFTERELGCEFERLIEEHTSTRDPDSVKIERIWPVLGVVPPRQLALRDRRQKLRDFTLNLFGDISYPIDSDDIPATAWRTLDEWLIPVLIKRLASFGSIQNLRLFEWRPFSFEEEEDLWPTTEELSQRKEEWLDSFYDFIQKEGKGELLDKKGNETVPDQTGKFRLRCDIAYDKVPLLFKTFKAEGLGVRIKERLLWAGPDPEHQIRCLKLTKSLDLAWILSVVGSISQGFARELGNVYNLKATLETKRAVLSESVNLTLVHLIPAIDRGKNRGQMMLIALLRRFFPTKVGGLQTETFDDHPPGEWSQAISACTNMLVKTIESFERMSRIPVNPGESPESLLNGIYEMLDALSARTGYESIYPDWNGRFRQLMALRSAENLPDELVKMMCILNRVLGSTICPDVPATLLYRNIILQGVALMPEKDVTLHADRAIAKVHGDPKFQRRPPNASLTQPIRYFYQAYVVGRPGFCPNFDRNWADILCDLGFDRQNYEAMIRVGLLPTEDLRRIQADGAEINRLQTRLAELRQEVEELQRRKEGLQHRRGRLPRGR
jgi:hypothetical protein